jgi:3-oxoadipate enol-lactonase
LTGIQATRVRAAPTLTGSCWHAWYRWIPILAHDFRVVRPDMRGFGDSSPMARDFPWTLDLVIDDFVRLMDSLDIQNFHLVGAKIGGTIARAFAARRPDRVRTLTVIGSPPPLRKDSSALANRLKEWDEGGDAAIRKWLRSTMGSRLGKAFPPEASEWWTDYMGRTSGQSEIGFFSAIDMADISDDIARIACPTLVITTEGSGLASLEETRAWQRQLANSRLLVLPGDSFHAAVTHAEQCAQATVEFIAEQAQRFE